jgi:hypothetical protein
MKKVQFYIIAIVTVLVALCWILLPQYFLGAKPSQVEAKTVLQENGDLCAGIAENAVANFQVMLEFQKLEKAGRKANVMRHCMRDHGFEENPVWLEYNIPISKKKAEQLSISSDEALENLKREAMYLFAHANQVPSYWHAKKNP